jgi:hypothetical protein
MFKGLPLAKELSKLGHEVEVLTGFPNYPEGKIYKGYKIRFLQREIIEGIPVIRVSLYPSHGKSGWRRINRLTWENAEAVFTLSDQMAGNLERWFDVRKTLAGKVIVIPNWADVEWIRPVAKDKNEFARKYNQAGKLTVMYSGNLGQTHDIETILGSATRPKEHQLLY